MAVAVTRRVKGALVDGDTRLQILRPVAHDIDLLLFGQRPSSGAICSVPEIREPIRSQRVRPYESGPANFLGSVLGLDPLEEHEAFLSVTVHAVY